MNRFIVISDSSNERWGEDRSSYNREYADRDWDTDNSANKYRDRTFDDEYDVEKDDSDSESRNNQSNIRKFKDNENSPSASAPSIEKRVNLNLNTAITNSPKKSSKPIKKVDLGAAANYGRDSSQSPLPASTTKASDDLLNDEFDPRATETAAKDNGTASEFGDFEAAFGNNTTANKNTNSGGLTKKTDDDFADFSSAFDQNAAQNRINVLSTHPTDFIGVAPTNINTHQFNQNSNDLLGDFSNLTLNTSTIPLSTNNNPSFNGEPSLLDGLTTGKQFV